MDKKNEEKNTIQAIPYCEKNVDCCIHNEYCEGSYIHQPQTGRSTFQGCGCNY